MKSKLYIFLILIIIMLFFNLCMSCKMNFFENMTNQNDMLPKSQIVPPVCPKCPNVVYVNKCNQEQKCPPCPPCGRCPKSDFECKKVPVYTNSNIRQPMPYIDVFRS